MSVLAILVYEMAVALGYYQEKIYAFHDIDHRRINMPIYDKYKHRLGRQRLCRSSYQVAF
jgi:hypothetical protein